MNKVECLERFNLEKALKLMKEGKSQKEIGEEFGLSSQRVSDCFKFYNIKKE